MKKNLIKTLYILINLLFFAGLCTFCYFNFDQTTEYFCVIMQKTYTAKLFCLAIGFSIAAYLSGVAICLLSKSKADELCSAYQKRHENISAQKDNDNAKISALEAKIATLEAALQSALKNKD